MKIAFVKATPLHEGATKVRMSRRVVEIIIGWHSWAVGKVHLVWDRRSVIEPCLSIQNREFLPIIATLYDLMVTNSFQQYREGLILTQEQRFEAIELNVV